MTVRPETRLRRVLMTTDTVGGVWTFTLELAQGLGAEGIEVVLAALGGRPSPEQAREASAAGNVRLLTSDFRLEWMEDPWGDVEESGRWLLELEREYRPDAVHLNSFGHGALAWTTPTILTAHSCVMSWWEAVKGEQAPASWQRYRTAVARSLQAVELVTAPSEAMAAALARHYGFEAGNCAVIRNGRDPAKFYRSAKAPFVFCAGRLWDEAKNIGALAGIAAALPWPVYAAGDPQTGRFEGCRMLGRLSASEMTGWYARAAIYALPARYEPFGLSILEAALSGCALVLGDTGSLREIWGEAALFVPPDDHDALRMAIETLAENSGLREAMAQRAYLRALTFDAGRMAKAYAGAYRTAMALRKEARSEECVS